MTPRKKEKEEGNSSGATGSENSSGEGEEESPSESQQTKETSTPGGPGSAEGEEQVTEIEAVEGAIDFNHPLLRGKSPEEIEALFESLDGARKSQNAELNRLHSELQAAKQQSAQPTEEPEDDGYGDSFLAPHMERMEKRITRRLEEAVAPLRAGLRRGDAMTARERLRGELRHFEVLEPEIDQSLRQLGKDPAAVGEELLRSLYYAAVGQAQEAGIDLSERETPQHEPPKSETPRHEQKGEQMAIPQHRPSSAPMPRTEEDRKLRDLTEEEEILRKHYGMSKEEYLAEQNKERDEIVEPGYSRDQW